MSLTPEELTVIVIAVVLVVAVAALMLFLIQRLRRRKAQLLHELRDRPELIQDRAYNRIAMARREAELLVGQGTDLARARDLIAQAQAAYDNRGYERAYTSAQLAHESLVNARRDRPLPSAAGAPPPSAASTVSLPRPSPAPAPSSGPGIPKNRAESKFQLSVLSQDLARARVERPGTPSTTEAMNLERDAQMAFDRGDFTEAFRLSLRGRRALGGTVESLPPTPSARAGATSGAAPFASAKAPDAGQSADHAARADRCPACGYPALAGDTYCRGCGAPRAPSACPQCGADRTPHDTFCGRCGARFD